MEGFYIGGAAVKLFLPVFKMNFLSTITATNLLLHMQQKVVLRHARPAPIFSGLNPALRDCCRPASRSSSTRRRSLRTAINACCPR